MKPYFETKLGKLYCGDCVDIIPGLEPADLVVTSPPYDNLRAYDRFKFDYKTLGILLFNNLLNGSVMVWVVADQTINGSETGTSFKQALYFKSLGLNLHDTMIYKSNKPPLTHNRYEQSFEYMFVLSKGKPKTFNPILEKTKHGGRTDCSTRRHTLDGLSASHGKGKKIKSKKIKGNIFHYKTGCFNSTRDKMAFEHPAIFPEALARDHIMSWSAPGDIVMDPMCGSGTTLKMAQENGRKWIGIEISEKYCEIAAKRIEKENQQLRLC